MISYAVILAGLVASALCQSSSDSSTMVTPSTQELAGLPVCAQNCLSKSSTINSQGACSSVDIKCLCSSVNYINVLACCLVSDCSISDQQKAVSFNFNLCARVNITIPNFLGCAVTSVSGGVTAISTTQGSTSAGSTFAGSTPAGSTFAGTSPTYTPTPVTIPSAASVVNYDGRSLLTGTCTSAQFAAATLVGGTILKYPWLGCASANPGCCPFSVAQPGPLNSCPVDYFTTSGACCPTGWSVYPSNLYGTQTPCYSIPAVPLVAPTGLKARAARIWPRAAATSLITTQLFTLRYPLVHYEKSLSASEKAGIAIGVVGGVILFAAMLFIFIRRYRAIRRKQLDDRSTIFSGPRSFGPTDPYDRRVSTFSSAPGGYYAQSEPPMAELPPPHAPRPPLNEEQLWFPSNVPQSSVQQPGLEQQGTHTVTNELEGDEHLHAHHPAFGSPVEETKPVEQEDGRVSPIQ